MIAMSAGNHAQGVAYHARRLGIPATIVMPRHTPFVKVENTRRFGARVVLEGEGVEEAALHARDIAGRDGLTFVHPFDDAAVIAGQGTLALEMLEAAPELEVLVVPIGGGGLIGGIATAAKALRPEIEIVGVEAALYPSVYRRLRGAAGAGRRADDRRGHRGQGARQAHLSDHRAPGRRRAPGRGGGAGGGDPAAARDREDRGRGGGCRRPRRGHEPSRPLPRPQGRARCCAAATSTAGCSRR